MSRVLQIKYYYIKNQIECPDYLTAFTELKYVTMMRQSRQLVDSTDEIAKILKMRYRTSSFCDKSTCPESASENYMYYDRYDSNCKQLISSYTEILNRWKNGIESDSNSKMSTMD